MILVTIGTQLPFDRLIKYVDNWAKNSSESNSIVAQVGSSDFKSDNMTILKTIEPELFEKYISQSDIIISHAGMGSILTALRVKKPIIIVPRSAAFCEHRNDHQLATARSFKDSVGVYVATTESELTELLENKDKLISGVLNDSVDYTKLLTNIKRLVLN
jgi:UDP-N-acetylglucosamine transferase subunit ALG13